jgi:hypothetical protein
MVTDITYKFVTDNREPIRLKHSEICYPPAIHQELVDRVDISYPGIVVKYPNGYLLEDGVHRIAKLQQQGIFESLFYVVSIEEYYQGIVHMMFEGNAIPLGEWCNNVLAPTTHKTAL